MQFAHLAGQWQRHTLALREGLHGLQVFEHVVDAAGGRVAARGYPGPELAQDLAVGAPAGLDVFWNEPHTDSRFMALDNVVLQPHHASGTIETRRAMGQLVRDNLAAHFAGRRLLTPVV